MRMPIPATKPRSPVPSFVRLGTLLLTVTTAGPACTGVIEDRGAGAAPAQGPGGGSNGGGGGNPSGTPSGTPNPPDDPGTVGAPGTSVGTSPPGTVADPDAAGPMPLRRLTIREYDNTVHDLLGDGSAPALGFPSDRDEGFGFRRAGGVAEQDARLLRTAAESLGAAAARNVAALVPCQPAANLAAEATCAQRFITEFGLRAFRRPLRAAEIDHLTALYTSARNDQKLAFPEAIGLLVEGLLQSPAFLYHWEASAAAPVREAGVVRLDGYQLASRLSYFLWGSMPDATLFAAAAADQLGTAAAVDAQARRMLDDPRAGETVAAFFSDWLTLDRLADASKDRQAYPAWNDALVAAMNAEAGAFVKNVAYQGDGRFATLLGGAFSFVNPALGAIYGLPARTGADLRRVDLDPAQRAGFLTQAGFLALTGAADGSHPVRRGKAVYEKLLCGTLPPPPANVPPPKPASAGGTTRERFEEHDRNDCARACHGVMDPLGFAFENYDGIGEYRTMDNGKPVDAHGEVTLDGASHGFRNAVELAHALGASDTARRCFAAEALRFALVRLETPADQASLEAAWAGFGPDAGVRDLLRALATMRSFRYRSPSPGEVLP